LQRNHLFSPICIKRGAFIIRPVLEQFTAIDRDFSHVGTAYLNSFGSTVIVSSVSRPTYQYIPKIFIYEARIASPADNAGIEVVY